MRNWRLNSRLLIFALSAFWLLAALARGDGTVADYTPAAMLAALQERDPVVDNYRLRFTRRETKRIDERAEFSQRQFSNFKFGGPREEPPEEFPEPYDAVLVANIDMAARGENLVFRNVWLTDNHGHPQIPRSCIRVEADATFQQWDDLGNGESILHIREIDRRFPSNNREELMFYELALGVGFGRRIKTVESVEKADKGWRLTGTFRLWTEDETAFEMETDAQLFVRKAHLHAKVHGNETSFDFSNSGAVETDGGVTFASEGTVKRIHVAHTAPGGARREIGAIQHDYAIEAGPIDFALTDEQFAQLSAIDAAQADFVIDERTKN